MEHRIFQDGYRSEAASMMRTKTGAAGGGMVVERVKEAVDLC
jgi:isoaspartyl peptidase/L-asparaginase-like protein (Ntn-hydrolase superfamily)